MLFSRDPVEYRPQGSMTSTEKKIVRGLLCYFALIAALVSYFFLEVL